MSKKPLVSVIILSYNYGKFLPRSLNSIFSQTFTDYEIILVDNGSTDNTPDIVKNFANRVIVHRFESNVGRAAGKNQGIVLAKGKYVQFLDADDFILPQKLEKQVAILENHSDIDIVCSESEFVDENQSPMSEASKWYVNRHFKENDPFLKKIAQENILLIHDGLIRYDAIKEIGGFDSEQDIIEDWDFWFRLATRDYRFYFISEVLAVYFKHGNSITSDPDYLYGLRKNFVYKHLANPELERHLGKELADLFKGYQHWILAQNAYNLRKWKECRAEVIASLKSDYHEVSFNKLVLFLKTLVR